MGTAPSASLLKRHRICETAILEGSSRTHPPMGIGMIETAQRTSVVTRNICSAASFGPNAHEESRRSDRTTFDRRYF